MYHNLIYAFYRKGNHCIFVASLCIKISILRAFLISIGYQKEIHEKQIIMKIYYDRFDFLKSLAVKYKAAKKFHETFKIIALIF